MAYGYSRAGAGIGTALVVPDPGLQNASAGIGTAYAASCPVMVVAGLIGLNRGELHEVHEQLDIIRPVTKWAKRALHTAEVPAAVHEAFVQLKTGRSRPVEVEIPWDTFSEVADVELYEASAPEPVSPSRASVREGARVLAASSRPLILAGGGAISSAASGALLKVAEHLQAPVVTTAEGKGVISDRHYLSLGAGGWRRDAADELMDSSDLILAVGTRLSRLELDDSQRVLQIDVDPEEVGRNHPNAIGIVGDTRLSLEQLYGELSASSPPRASRRKELEAVKSARSIGRRGWSPRAPSSRPSAPPCPTTGS